MEEELVAKFAARDYAGARAACEAVLATDPGNALVAQYLKASKDLSRDMKMREEDSTALEQSEALWELNDAAKAAYTPKCVNSGAPSAAPSPALPASAPSAAATRTRAAQPPQHHHPPSTNPQPPQPVHAQPPQPVHAHSLGEG